MICDLFAGADFFGGTLQCAADPLPSFMASLVALLVAGLSVLWAVFRAKTIWNRIGSGLAVLASMCLGFAAGLPELERTPVQSPGGRIVVLLDVSESTRRGGDRQFAAERETLADGLASAVAEADRETEDWSGYVVRFSDAAETVAGPVNIPALPSAVLSMDPGAVGDDTDIEAGLLHALDIIQNGSGVGSIWLLSDGWSTEGDIETAVRRVVASGIPVHVLPSSGSRETAGLISADLGPEQWVGQEAIVRVTTLGRGTLAWNVNGESADPEDIPDSDQPQGIRLTTRFGERGLGFARVAYRSGEAPQAARTLFTLVRGPARILAYGDADWLSGADETRFHITRAAPDEAVELGKYDVVIVDGLRPDAFDTSFPERLLARGLGGAGVFLVNGPLTGEEIDRQNISLWEETALGPVLPFSADPEEFLREPPQRDILIIIDKSGSMGEGSRMADARRVVLQIMEHVRPVDSLKILPFSTQAEAPFEASRLTDSKRSDAKIFVRNLRASGNTFMDRALAAARALRGNYCALFIVGDGGYDANQVSTSPICQTISIGIDGARLPGFGSDWGESIAIRPGANVGDLTFDYFQPEPRERFWRDGRLRLLDNADFEVFEPLSAINGLALAYPRPETNVWAVTAEPPRDPVVGFRQDPVRQRLTVGAFLSELPAEWEGSSDGRTAVDTMLEWLVGWKEPERYGIELRQSGGLFELEIVALQSNRVPTVLSASVIRESGLAEGFSMQRGRETGVFRGQGRLRLENEPTRGVLAIDAGGGDVEYVPIVLPALNSDGAEGTGPAASERMSFGTNFAFLDRLRRSTGGSDISTVTPQFEIRNDARQQTEIWAHFVIAALVSFACSLYFGGVRR